MRGFVQRLGSVGSLGDSEGVKSLKRLGNKLGKFGGGRTIGLDLDRGALKAVQVSRSGGSYYLRHVGYRSLTPGAIVEGEVADHDLLVQELREFWSAHGFKGKSVLLGLANQKVVVRLLEMPRMSEEDLKGAIQFEAQDNIPLPLDEAILDYVSLGPVEEGADLDRVLVVAAQSEMVRRFTGAVRAAGLNPAGMDVKAFSLARSMLPVSPEEEPENVAEGEKGATVLLDVGYELSNLVVAQDQSPMLARFLPGGASQISRSVSGYTGMPEEEAERQLMNPEVHVGSGPDRELEGETPNREEPSTESAREETEEIGGVGGTEETEDTRLDPAVLYDVRRGVEDAVQSLAEDVQRSIEYHYSQPGSREVAQVVVSGEGTMISGFEEYLGELLGLPVSRGRPLGKVSANRSNVSDEQLDLMQPVLAVAVGLAVEDAEEA